MIADVAFDAPVDHPFSYRVPPGLTVARGQRVLAPLKGARRVGIVVTLREGNESALKSLLGAADRAPILSPPRLDLVAWIARESLSTVGSTCAALLPPPAEATARGPDEAGPPGRAAPAAPVELLVGAGRERRLLERVAEAPGALVIVPDIEAAARWAQRLARRGPVVRLDSGADEAACAQA